LEILAPIFRRWLLAPWKTVIVDDYRSWKGYQLAVASLHLARAIEQASDRPRIGVMLPTSGLFPVALAAGWLLGRTVVPLNYLLKEEERDFIIEDAQLDAVVTVTPMMEQFGGFPDSVTVLAMDKMSFRGIPRPRRIPRLGEDATAILLYTSGTSGRPKGVILSIANLAANVTQCANWASFGANDCFIGVLPQFHSFGLTVTTVLPLSIGAKAIYTARFNPRRVRELLQVHRPTALLAIPSMYNALLASKGAAAEDFESLEFIVSGGEPLPDAVFDGFQERFGVTIEEGYGLTETAPVTNWCRPQEHRRGSVGMPLDGIEQRIVGDDGAVMGPGEDGEIRMRGPNIMSGYLNRPQETEDAFDDEGFFRSGDIGHHDENGHLHITGRLKEMLIIGGENVFPREIEEVLNRHPWVHDCAVIGVPDPARGEVAMAFVEIAEGASFNERELRAHCRESLAQFKVPREIRLLEALPRNPTGKIMRRALSAEVTEV
jgi:long-chain acyl-CoA synthetase